MQSCFGLDVVRLDSISILESCGWFFFRGCGSMERVLIRFVVRGEFMVWLNECRSFLGRMMRGMCVVYFRNRKIKRTIIITMAHAARTGTWCRFVLFEVSELVANKPFPCHHIPEMPSSWAKRRGELLSKAFVCQMAIVAGLLGPLYPQHYMLVCVITRIALRTYVWVFFVMVNCYIHQCGYISGTWVCVGMMWDWGKIWDGWSWVASDVEKK